MSLNLFLKDTNTISRLRRGPLGIHLDSFAQEQHNQGYNFAVAGLRIRIVAGFCRWLKQNRIQVEKISVEEIASYLQFRRQKSTGCDASALKHFVAFLQRNGVIEGSSTTSPTAVMRLIDDFVLYLRKERGLATSSELYYVEFAEAFLTETFGAESVDLSSLSAAQVICFVQNGAVRYRKRAKLMVTALRSFFRFLRYRGHIEIDLAAAVPSVSRWSMTTIPKSLSPDQVERVLTSSKGFSDIDLRDHAMLLLLARLGLRAGEIVSLKLDDIDWKAGCITFKGKGGKLAKMPLPIDVGDAIASYLLHGRPASKIRNVFLRERAPIAALTPSTVSTQVQRALMLAGIESPNQGAHQFRHSLATQMLSRGFSLSEIGEILRHRSTQTTEIYAKVDFNSLCGLALPWPGGAQ